MNYKHKYFLLFISIIFTGILSFFITPNVQAIDTTYDVVIAGAGTGGIGAAIQAARLGSKVLLLEETDYIGGQMTAAGVTSTDRADERYSTGIFKDFENRVRAYYQQRGKSVGTCYWSSATFCFEPSVGQQILLNMIAEQTDITLVTRAQITGVGKSGNNISSVTIKTPAIPDKTISTKILIDATEYGDILPLAGVPYRIGNSTGTAINLNACIQDITYTAVIKKYPNGVPNNLFIPNPPPDYSTQVEAYFASKVALNGVDYTDEGWDKDIMTWRTHNVYRGMPDSTNPTNYTGSDLDLITKTGINYTNDYPVTARYLNDKIYRKEVNCQAKLKTIQFIYYVQHVLGETNWSVANDEGYNTSYNQTDNLCPDSIIPANLKEIEKNMPVMPYVRESRRMIGLHTMVAGEVTPNRNMFSTPSSIALADYSMDLHNCNTNDTLESDLENSGDKPIEWYTGVFQIPFESLVNNTVPNFIAAEKNFSQSRYVNGATRLQPSTMMIGQAAGAIAALAVKNNVSPSALKPFDVQKVLIANNAMVFPFIDSLIGTPYFTTIQEIALRGIMTGYGNLIFGPEDPLTREQAAAVLVRAFKLPKSATYQNIFTDVPATNQFFSFIESLYTNDITPGCETNPRKYCPNDNVSNAQLAIFTLISLRQSGVVIPNSQPATPTYSDVPPSHQAYSFVETLAANGIKWYCNETTKSFCPEQNIKRSNTTFVIISALQPLPTATPTPTPTPTPKPGDLNGDGKVDFLDYNILVASFGYPYTIFDYNVLVGNWGK